MIEQFNMFGGVNRVEDTPKSKHGYKSMQELHGYKEAKKCETCENLLKFGYHNRRYFKCALWVISHSASTDIRLKDKACGKWEKRRENGGKTNSV